MMIRDITLEISYMMGIYTLFLTAFSLFGFICKYAQSDVIQLSYF